MKNLKLNIAVFLALLIAISGCQKDDIVTEPMTEPVESQFQEGMIQLGKKLENPYTVENMRKAYQTLSVNSQLKSATVTESEIDVTHLYVRFLPKTDEEYALLLNDTTLQLFDYPLDYEIEEGGTYYLDPELPDSKYSWKYCAVEKDYNLPNIEYEIIEELFLPESMEDETSLKSSETWSFWDDLEIEALKITGNLDESESSNLKSTMGRKKWKPSGKIQMFDNTPSVNRLVPLRGVKARAYSWFTTKEALTGTDGTFLINHNFKGHVNYSIKWERNDFEIRSKNFGQAYYNGPRWKEKAWNLDIESGLSRMYAIIHRAAHRYYYEDHAGLRTPPKRNQMLGRLTIGAYDWEQVDPNGNINPFRRWTTWPEIKIFKPSRTCEELFSTTTHELAHASHWELDRNNDFTFCDLVVCESWARGVQWVITRLEYPSHTVSYGRLNYTGVVEDMIDGFGTTNSWSWWDYSKDEWGSPSIHKSYSDQVSGYTIRQIEDALKGQRTWNGWRDNIKNKYTTNGTRNNLDAAFTYWNTK